MGENAMTPKLQGFDQVVGELAISILFLVLIIAVHGSFLTVISRRFTGQFAKMSVATPDWRIRLLMATTIAALVVIHLFEALIWSVPLYLSGLADTFRHCFTYVMEAYTTLGAGDVRLPDGYQLIGPMIAMSGLFTFGWTGSTLVFVMGEILKLAQHKAHKEISQEPAEFKKPVSAS
jgi:hypothetical protein